MTKLELTDTGFDVVRKMSEGNPGALTVCMQILQRGAQIDPDNAFGGLGVLLSLDTLGIYGSHIWLLYKDICGEDLVSMLGVLRAWQLGFASEQEISNAITSCNNGRFQHGLNIEALVVQVREQLPNFGKEAE